MFSIHHLTHIDNLKDILENGLKSRNTLKNENKNFADTAENDIIIKRNGLNEYIPFHFTFIQKDYGIPYNYTVCKKENPRNIIFLVAVITHDEDERFLFNLYHPISIYKETINSFTLFKEKFYKEISKYSNEFGFLNYSEQEVKNLFMSEILFKTNKITINNHCKIYVYSQEIKNKIDTILNQIKIDKIKLPEIIVDNEKIFFRGL